MNSLWDILSVAIGVSFIFMILSILNSWVQEYIATVFSLRANNLADILQNLLEPGAKRLKGMEKATAVTILEKQKREREEEALKEGMKSDKTKRVESESANGKTFQKMGERLQKALPIPKISRDALPLSPHSIQQLDVKQGNLILDLIVENPVKTLYKHPIVYSLSKPNELPDYLPAKDFAVAIMDLLDKAGCGETKTSSRIEMENIRDGITKLESNKDTEALGYRLRSLLYSAQINGQGKKDDNPEIAEFRNAVSDWYEDTVARGSVWYKRKMQRIGILCGIVLAVLLNADTIALSNSLWHNAMLRETISQAAATTSDQGQSPDSDQAKQQLSDLIQMGLPMGWSFSAAGGNLPSTPGGWLTKAVGLLLTGFAISQGSQVWFDLMNRLLNVRSSGNKTDSDEHHTVSKKSK